MKLQTPKKKIVVLDGHPASATLSDSIATHYEASARKNGHEIRKFALSEMVFDSDFGQSNYENAPLLEPDLQDFWEALEQCDHFVMAFPLWWGGMPAKLKGLFDRVLLPGKGFRMQEGAYFPEKLLKGKTGRIFMTSDTVTWYLKIFYGAAIFKQLKNQILGYVGIAPVRFTNFAPTKDATETTRRKWLAKVEEIAAKAQ